MTENFETNKRLLIYGGLFSFIAAAVSGAVGFLDTGKGLFRVFSLISSGALIILFSALTVVLLSLRNRGNSGEPEKKHLVRNIRLQQLLSFASVILAALAVWKSGECTDSLQWLKPLGFCLIVSAFPVLVLQRYIHSGKTGENDRMDGLYGLSGMVVFMLVAGGLTALGRAFDVRLLGAGPFILASGVTVFRIVIAATAVELVLKNLSLFFIPLRGDGYSGLGNSLFVSFLFSGINPFKSIGRGLRDHFGVDPGSSWTVRFCGRAAFPVISLIILTGWLATGMTSLGVDERGVYERFGKAEKVLYPGLNFHLPWPFGKVCRMDYGVERRVFLAKSGKMVTEAMPENRREVPVESPSTRWEDRLWETSHGREIFFLTASSIVYDSDGSREHRGVRPYEMINADIVIHYRTGKTDRQVMAACYNTEEPESLVLRQAGRWIQAVFSSSTPESLVGADRKALSDRMRESLQKELDFLDTGLEITGVYFEAIHPPIEAAMAFYDVQAAEHDAQAQVASAKAISENIIAGAAVRKMTALDSAKAVSSEILSEAVSEDVMFRAQADSYNRSPAVFKMETYLDSLVSVSGLKRLFIVDHDLSFKSGYNVDLRRFVNDTVKIHQD